MLVQLKSGHHKFGIPSSAPVMNNRKSESGQKSNPPSIPRRCASSRGNLPSSSSGSKRLRERDLSELNANEERMRKKPKDSSKVTVEAEKAEVHDDSIVSKKKKLTGRSIRSHYKRMEEKAVPEKTATDKSEKLLNFQGIKEHVHSDSSSKKRRRLTKKYVQSSQDTNDSGRDILLDEEDIDKEKPYVDGGRSPVLSSSLKNAKNAIEENSANKEHYGDQDDTPSQQKLALEVKSAESDAGIILNDVQIKCDKRWEKFFQKEKEEIQKDDISKLETCKKLEAALNELQEKFDKRWVKLIRKQQDQIKKFSELETDKKLEAAFIRTIHGKSSTTIDKLHVLDGKFAKIMAENNFREDMTLKDLEAEQLAEIQEESRKVAGWVSKVKARILSKPGAKDVMPLIEQHGENNDSSLTVQGKNVVQSEQCNAPNGNPSSASNSSLKNEGGLTFSDTPISAVVEQINQPKHLGTGESICADLPASGERVLREMQSPELHEDIPSELPETFANEIVDNANPVNVSTNTPIKGFGEGDAIELPHAENFGSGERIFQYLPVSGESVPGEVQPLELHGDVPAELPETVANEILDNANPVDLSTNTPIEGFGEGDAIDLPDAKQLTQPNHFGSAERTFTNPPDSGERVEMQSLELHKCIPAELAVTVDKEIVDIVNPVELSDNTSTEGFGEEDAFHLADARNETDGTAIDDLDLDGQVLETSEQTKASQHPCTPLPLRVQEDQDVVSAELQGHGVEVVGKENSSVSEVISPELVDTATNSLPNIESQAQEEPAIETQSSSRTEVSTSKIIDTVIAEQSFIKLLDQETSVVKDQVTLQIEHDTAAPAATLELVGTAKTLQSDNEFQDQVEPAIESQSTPRIEVAVSEYLNNTSHVLSSTEQQNEDALIVENRVSLEIEVSNSGVADNVTPVQSHNDAPPIESGEQLQFMPIDASPSCNQLPPPELESQNHNLGRNSSGAAEIEMLSHESTSQIIEDWGRILGVGPETQSFPATRVQIPVSFQNNVAAEVALSTTGVLDQAVRQLGGVSHLPSYQVAPSNSPSLLSDPFQSELEKTCKEIKELEKSHEDMMSGLESEREKEIEKLVAEIRRKYQLKFEVAQAQFSLKRDGLEQNLKKISMNKKLADAFKLRIEGSPSSSTQYQQHPVRLVGATPLNQQITSLNRQAMQQLSVPLSTRLGPFTSQTYAAPSVQAAAAQRAVAMCRQFRAINGVNRMTNTCIPHSGENIHSSSPHIRPFIPAAAPYNHTAALLLTFQNPQQQQQPLAAPQWPSSYQNPQHLGSLSYEYLSALALQQHHQLPG